MILNTFEAYVYLAGALAIGVLAIEVGKSPHFCGFPEARHTRGLGETFPCPGAPPAYLCLHILNLGPIWSHLSLI